MKVREIMSSPVTTVRADARVTEITRLLLKSDFSGLPVVDERGSVLGLVTEADVVTKHARVHGPSYLGILGGVIPLAAHRADEEMRRVLAVTARDLMSTKFESVQVDDDVDDAAAIMVERDANPVPVFDADRLVGIVSRSDIIRLLVQEEADTEENDVAF